MGDRSGTAARRRAAADAAASLYRTCPNRSPPRPAAVRVPLRDDRGHGGPRMSVRLAVEPTSGTLLQVAPHDGDAKVWDDFIAAAEGSTFCHCAAWREVLRDSLGAESYDLVARDGGGAIRGVLPLARVRSLLFGDYLVSLPFLNAGGPLGDATARDRLIRHATALARRLGVLVVFGAVYRGAEPVAAGCGFLWRGEMEITWASALRAHQRLAPNMQLYWAFLEQAIARSARVFDFGRCTPGGGTHHFKRQWGGVDVPLPWAQWSPHGIRATPSPERPVYRVAVALWKRLPMFVTNRLGPRLAKRLP